MGVFLKLFFLTFVLSFFSPLLSIAAPSTKTTFPSNPPFDDDNSSLILLAPELREKEVQSYLNISVGFAGGNYVERDQYQQGPVGSLRFAPLKDKIIDWDYEVQIGPENLVLLGMGRRWYCCQNDEFNPFFRASANLVLVPENELAGLAEIRRWRLRAAIGLGQKLTCEVGIGLAITGPDIFAQLGYNIPL